MWKEKQGVIRGQKRDFCAKKRAKRTQNGAKMGAFSVSTGGECDLRAVFVLQKMIRT